MQWFELCFSYPHVLARLRKVRGVAYIQPIVDLLSPGSYLRAGSASPLQGCGSGLFIVIDPLSDL